jgi:hypothetical protein
MQESDAKIALFLNDPIQKASVAKVIPLFP